MSVRDFTLTLNGAAQRLSTVLAVTEPGGSRDEAYRQLMLQADPANAAAVYVGSSNAVSAASHGFSLDPTQATAPVLVIGPFETGPVKLSEIWVLGTNTEKLHIFGIPF